LLCVSNLLLLLLLFIRNYYVNYNYNTEMNEDNLPDSPVQTETLETRVRKQMTEERKQQID
jgi:hypothetical protein